MPQLNTTTSILKQARTYNLRLITQYLSIRYKIFVCELARSIIGEFNVADVTAKHYVFLINKQQAGIARVIYKNHTAEIGRVAILAKYRNQGYGVTLINQIIDKIKISRKECLIKLFTESKNIEFYKKCGFIENGEMVFDNVLLIGMTVLVNR